MKREKGKKWKGKKRKERENPEINDTAPSTRSTAHPITSPGLHFRPTYFRRPPWIDLWKDKVKTNMEPRCERSWDRKTANDKFTRNFVKKKIAHLDRSASNAKDEESSPTSVFPVAESE